MKALFDIHCHMLPDVDDGAADINETMWLLWRDYEDGVRYIFLTPHFRHNMFETTNFKIYHYFKQIKELAEEEFHGELSLYLGSEVHVSETMEQELKEGERLTMAATRYVLTEFGRTDPLEDIVSKTISIIDNGYIPILAHPERYQNLMADFEKISELREYGAKMQINADSIIGEEGFRSYRNIKRMMKENLVDYVGSDAHNQTSRTPHMKRAYERVINMMGEEYADRIFIENPQKILEERNTMR